MPSAVCGAPWTGVGPAHEDSKTEQLPLEHRVRRACWQWPALPELGQECMFRVDELLLLLLQKTTWRCSCYSEATQRNRTEDLGRKRLSVKEAECAAEVPVSQGQRVVSIT